MTVGPIRLVTLGVSRMERSLELYRDLLGLTVERDGEAPPALLEAWGVGGSARIVELSCRGYPVGRLRLVEYDPPATTYVRRDRPGERDSVLDIGPRAIDFYPARPVPEALAELEAAGYVAKSRPVLHAEGHIQSREVTFYGPDGEAVLIMEGEHGEMWRDFSPAPYSEIPTVSVTCADLDATRALYGGAFGLEAALDVEVPAGQRDLVCVLTGAPPGTRIHFLVYKEPGEPSGKYLFVHFYGASEKPLAGGMRPGHLGISLYTHEVDDLERYRGSPGLRVERGPAEVEGRRLALARGPNEELFELVEPS
jgi:catechol 2,3-dioxygenase-like lactoylglutathione lyase family enzyme